MPRCPFAKWTPITGPVGPHAAGPFRIIHHTTEGSTAAGAMGAYRANRSDPHFTVDQTTVFQHIDTGQAARALRNLGGGVETNRLSAIQIEVVGTATKPKPRGTMENVARLCRWLEETHGVPAVWPAGPPKPAANGRDPGGHNRDARIWARQGGHYGHSQVPENTHWDPGYTADEAKFVLRFDPDNRSGFQDPDIEALRRSFPEHAPVEFDDIAIPDHAEVGEQADVEAAETARSRRPALGAGADVASEAAVLMGALFVVGALLIALGLARRRAEA